MEPKIRHVRYEDFYSLSSNGVGDIESFCRAVDALVQQMGGVCDHHVLLDLRRATIPPIAVSELTQAIDELARRGIGVVNKVAIVYDAADAARAMVMVRGQDIAVQMGIRLHSFDDTC
jgi:ABC-type lipopolysaccharide export system ATPase subunit